MSKKGKIFKQWSKVFFITLLLVFLVQTFLIQIFKVSSSSMESSIYRGDRVWVNKAAYGLRLPTTLFAIPFVYDSIFGLKSYIDKPLLPYYRFFLQKVSEGDIVLLNNPQDKSTPLDKRELLISRCIAVAGDTLLVNDNEITVNGTTKPLSPDITLVYKIHRNIYPVVDSLVQVNRISNINIEYEGDSVLILLSKYQAYLINQNLPISIRLLPNNLSISSYSLIVPHKNYTVDLDNRSVLLFSSIILDEDPNIVLKSGALMVNDTILHQYTFKYDYYWVLSDNLQTGIDSRSFGFVSERDIIGEVFHISHKSK